MSVKMVFNTVNGGNYYFSGSLSENRNENEFIIHDNNMGETLFKSSKIWDSDLIKLFRVFEAIEYNRIGFKDIIKAINKNCRHLKIDCFDYMGGYLLIDSSDL